MKYTKSFPVSNTSISEDDNKLTGYASVMGVLDQVNDVLMPGCFTSSLSDFLSNGFCSLDHEWDIDSIVAYPTSCTEKGNKLVLEAAFHSDQHSQDSKLKCMERISSGLSMGLSVAFTTDNYQTFNSGSDLISWAKKNNYDMSLIDVKNISSCGTCQAVVSIDKLFEVALTTTPCNIQALITQIKSICGSKTLPLAPRDTTWSKDEADKRVREFCGATEKPNEKYSKAFVVCDGDEDNYGSYHFPFADIIDDKMVAVPKAIFSIAANLQGARTSPNISVSGVKAFCVIYYNKMTTEFDDDTIQVPWNKSIKSQLLGPLAEHDMCLSSISQLSYNLHKSISECLKSDVEDKKAQLDSILTEYKDLCMSVCSSCFKSLESELTWKEHTEIVIKAVQSIIERAKERKEARNKDGRKLSKENINSLNQLIDELTGILDISRTESIKIEAIKAKARVVRTLNK